MWTHFHCENSLSKWAEMPLLAHRVPVSKCFKKEKKKKKAYWWDSGQTPPIYGTWQIEYFKVTEFENFPHPSLLKEVIKSPYTWRNGASPRPGHQKESGGIGLDKSPPRHCPSLLPSGAIIFSHDFLLFIKPSTETLRFNHFFRSPFSYEDSSELHKTQ